MHTRLNSAKAVFFDLDDTLYRYNICHTKAMNAVFDVFSYRVNLEREIFDALVTRAKQAVKSRLKETAASHHRLLYFQHVAEQLRLSPMPLAYEAHQTYWSTFIGQMRFAPGAERLITGLRTVHKKMFLITDLVADVQYQKIEKLGLDLFFKGLVTSEEAGIEKPNPPMFELALKKAQVNADEAIMIGDNYKKDCLGASALGIPSVWVNADGGVIPDSKPASVMVVSSLEALC